MDGPDPFGRLWRVSRSLAVAAFVVATGPAEAQSWFDGLFQPFRAAPPAPSPRVPRYYPSYADPPMHRRAPKPRPHPVVERLPEKPERTGKEVSVPVAVLGDSLGQLLGLGLTDDMADKPQVGILRRARENTGLTRDDVFDWVKGARDLADSSQKLKAAVILVGSNDRQPLRDGDTSYEPFSPRWLDLYRARVAAVAGAFKARGIPLVWVGLPVPRSDRLAADFARLNDIYREEAGKAGATFVDVWEAFADERGQYAAVGPGLDGQVVRLRTADGVNFTRAGTLKLAHFVGGELRRDLDMANPGAPAAAVPSPTQPQTEESAPAAQTMPTAPTVPAKPVSGPIMSLTAPPAATGGLAQRDGLSAGDAPVATVLARGRAPDSRARQLSP